MKHSRAGSVIKWIGILVAVALLIGAGAFFYFRYRLTRGSEKPLEMPETLADPKVAFSLKRNIEQHTYAPGPGASAAAPSPGTISLTGQELTLMISKLLPAIPGMKMNIEIVDGKADLKCSLPTKELMKVVKDELGSLGDTIEKNLQWVNIDATAGLRFAEDKLEITVKSVKTPDFVSVKQMQDVVNNAIKQRQPGPIIVPFEGMPFQVLELDLDGNVAVTKVTRAPDAKR